MLVTVDGDGLRWYESGTISWDGRRLAAERTLGLRRLDGQWWMTFADGSRFHPWLVDEPVIHPCAADTYRGLIEPRGPDDLTVTWDVSGPTKNQLIVSRLSRIG